MFFAIIQCYRLILKHFFFLFSRTPQLHGITSVARLQNIILRYDYEYNNRLVFLLLKISKGSHIFVKWASV